MLYQCRMLLRRVDKTLRTHDILDVTVADGDVKCVQYTYRHIIFLLYGQRKYVKRNRASSKCSNVRRETHDYSRHSMTHCDRGRVVLPRMSEPIDKSAEENSAGSS